MAEWLKAHAWKACLPQGNVGSNPTLSAIAFAKSFKICVNRLDCAPYVTVFSLVGSAQYAQFRPIFDLSRNTEPRT